MAGDAEAHRVIHHTPSDRHLRNIPMACRALNFGADVRRVIETNVRFVGPPVNALPGNFFTAHFVCGHFHDLGLVGRNCLMAHHAVLDAGNARHRTFRNSNMAEIALELGFFDMWLVLIGDRLNRFGANSEEMTNRLAERFVRGREYLI